MHITEQNLIGINPIFVEILESDQRGGLIESLQMTQNFIETSLIN